MVYLVMILLALAVVELAALIAAVIWRIFAEKQPPERDVRRPSGAFAAEKGARGHAPEGENDENRRKTEEYEKRLREGIDSMMGYDLAAARRAVRNDADEGLD